MNSTKRGRPSASINFQSLEERRLLAVFGNAWPDARDLSISFPADGVAIDDSANDIGETLDGLATRQQWQESALRAYQTWAVHADINVGLRNDHNTDFGVPGLTTKDPRFGEFRVGAFPQTSVLASSVPFQAVAGTYSGDLLLNSNQQWSFHDWADNQGPDPSTINEGDRDVFTLLLHEAGNTLGLQDTFTDWTVMFGYYNTPKGTLSAEDIASIQALYGARTDPYELVDNGQLHSATIVPIPVGIDLAAEVIRTRGSLLNGSDVDHYKIVPADGYDSATVRVRASGVSLLKSRLEVVDAAGQVIQQADAASVFENDNTLTISGLTGHDELYLRLSALDPSDIYAVGDYLLEVDYRNPAVQATDPTPAAYDAGPDELFTNYALADSEFGENEALDSATTWDASEDLPGERFELHSSVSSATDVDFFKITAPQSIEGKLSVTLTGVSENGPELDVRVLDANGQRMGTAGYLRHDGTFVIEVAQPIAGQEYFVRVSVDPTSTVGVGDYLATAEFEAPSEQMNHVATGEVSGDVDNFGRWTAPDSKLYRFDLSAMGVTTAKAVRLTIYDAHTREPKMVAVAQAGVTRGALAWLEQGEYILRFSAISYNEIPAVNMSYTLTVDGISDDMDDNPYDPGNDPDLYSYDYEYEYDPDYQYTYSDVEIYYPDYYTGYSTYGYYNSGNDDTSDDNEDQSGSST